MNCARCGFEARLKPGPTRSTQNKKATGIFLEITPTFSCHGNGLPISVVEPTTDGANVSWKTCSNTSLYEKAILVKIDLYPSPREARWRNWLARSAAIVEVKQLSQWLVFGWVTKNLVSRAPSCFGRHVKPFVPAASAVGSTHQSALGPRGGSWPYLPIPCIGKACAPAVGTLIG
ncbi:hypothetical protein evm_010986 [Chilo suppressalis]|nr:hypothetical protein evm_010986 [Chilo suppressalis]